MSAATQALCGQPVFRFFRAISDIPHPSKQEKQLSDYLLRWARERGLEAQQDGEHNIFIRKPAASGYETAPCVMLQAHMDMVCEKAPGVEHDFQKDPIHWELDGDMLSTGGRTTLGADDGMGVAMAMAVLDDDTLPHPALEVLFTTAEEEDFSGSEGFDFDKMTATRLINLDHANEKQILCGSCGGISAELTVPIPSGPVPEGWTAVEIAVDGLHGGHSGEDIHRGHGNAVTLLARVLLALGQTGELKLGPVKGGTFRLAIPREAAAVVCIPREREQALAELLAGQEALLRRELSATGDKLTIRARPTEKPDWCSPPERFLAALLLAPDGIYQMNETLVGLVDTSDNMGECYLDQTGLRLVFEIRSARDSLRDYLFQRIRQLALLLGGQCAQRSPYPSWDFQPDSPLRQAAERVYVRQFGHMPEYLTVHAGLEVGLFSQRKPGLDAISIGPDCWNFHSPSERVSVSSAQRTYELLRGILTECRA